MKPVTNQDLLHMMNQRTRLLTKAMNTYMKAYGLFASQWSILFCLHRFGPMSQTEIWRYLHVEAPTVTRTLVKMEKNGWVVRSQGADKRERIIDLTEKAQAAYKDINEKVNQLENDVLRDFTEEDKQQLYHLLQKMKETTGEETI